MNILLFIDNLNIGGAQTQIVNLAIGLKSKTENVILATYFDENQYQEHLKSSGIQVIRLSKKGKIDIGLARRLAQTCTKFRIHSIIAYQHKPSFYALLSKVLFGNKASVIVSERTFEAGVPKFDKLVTRNLYRYAKAIVANSFHQAEILKGKNKSWKDKVKVIYNGIESKYFKKEQPSISTQILSVGRVDPVKNIENIIEGLAQLKKQKINFQYRWVGESFDERFKLHFEYKQKIDALIALNDLKANWEWHPKTAQIIDHYNQADMLIHFSVGEGFPNVLTEAMASGLCVFASDIGDHHRIIEDGVNGYLCHPDDGKMLAEKIKSYLSLSSDQKTKLKSNAASTARELFSMDKMINEYYKTVC